MNIQQENTSRGGRFFYNEHGRDLAEMDYTWRNGVMVILHTEVDPSLEGKGVGKALVNAAAADARAGKYTILPICAFAKAVMTKGDAYADVLDGGSASHG